MSKLTLSTIALSVTFILAGCQSLVDSGPSQAAKEKQYESAPDLSNAEVLTSKNVNNGGLISDANDNFIDPNAANQAAYDPVNNLEKAEASPNTQIGAADPHLSVQEFAVANDPYNNLILESNFDNGINRMPSGHELSQNQSAQLTPRKAPPLPDPRTINAVDPEKNPNQWLKDNDLITGQDNENDFSQKTADDYAVPVNSVGEFKSDTSRCSVSLSSEASGIARTLIKDLISRLRSETGTIFVAPTIVDQEYADCVSNVELAIQDGLLGNAQFLLTAGNTNLQNIISQNIGSATVLPSLIHQCRAASIPYLVISQVRRTGDKAALSIRIVRTEDGITLSQTYRRLSQ